MGDYLKKHHPPHYHREIRATYLYISNDLLKIDHKIMHKWDNDVITPIHTVAVTQNRTVLQGFANVLHIYVNTNTKTLT